MRHFSLSPFPTYWRKLQNRGYSIYADSLTVTVLTPDLARRVLSDREHTYVDQSGFFRTSARPTLSPVLLQELSRRTKQLLSQPIKVNDKDIDQYIESRNVHRTLTFGPELVYAIVQRLLAPDGSALRDVSADYLRQVVIQSSIEGRIRTNHAEQFTQLSGEAERLLLAGHMKGRPAEPDGISSVLLPLLPHLLPGELGELYLRLVLAMTGFTGIALEWALVSALDEARANGRREIHGTGSFKRSQQEAPTAWRLVRTAREDHVLGTEHIAAGTDVVIPITHLHAIGNDYLPFGYGPRACPAARIVPDLIDETVSRITERYSVFQSADLTKRPYVQSLWGLGRGYFRFVRRST